MTDNTKGIRGLVFAVLLSGPLWAALIGACWLVWRVIGGGL